MEVYYWWSLQDTERYWPNDVILINRNMSKYGLKYIAYIIAYVIQKLTFIHHSPIIVMSFHFRNIKSRDWNVLGVFNLKTKNYW